MEYDLLSHICSNSWSVVGRVLSPILFCVYIDDLVKQLELSRVGCWVGGCYLGCILYADDLILMSSSVCDLQRVVNVCVNEFSNCDMHINASKYAVLRIGPRFSKHCADICSAYKACQLLTVTKVSTVSK